MKAGPAAADAAGNCSTARAAFGPCPTTWSNTSEMLDGLPRRPRAGRCGNGRPRPRADDRRADGPRRRARAGYRRAERRAGGRHGELHGTEADPGRRGRGGRRSAPRPGREIFPPALFGDDPQRPPARRASRHLAAEYRPECVIELIWQACLTYDVESHRVRRLAEEELRPAVPAHRDRLLAFRLGADRPARRSPLGDGARPPLGQTRAGKGDRHLLCEAPEGPFRQKEPVPFSSSEKADEKPAARTAARRSTPGKGRRSPRGGR